MILVDHPPKAPMGSAPLCDLTGKVALVTGASRGIGRAVALALARHGADVLVNSRKPEGAEAAVAFARPTGRVLVMTSIGALVGLPRLAAYNATKGGLLQLTRTFALESPGPS